LLGHALIRIVLTLLAIAIPFAVVAILFNLYVSDKLLKKVGASLLAAIILPAYRTYVRIIEKRRVVELSGTHAIRELSVGVLLGAVLLSLTIGALPAQAVQA
jgi:uncharacterized membrane protein YfcA